jgi:transcription termination factor NusA
MNHRNELTTVKGIDAVLARRLVDGGITTLDALAAADAGALAGIEGLPSRLAPEIITRARAKIDSEQRDEESLSELIADASRLKGEVETLVLHIRDRLPEEAIQGKQQKALRKEITRTLASLERVEAALSEQLRRFGKGLAKADATLSEVSDGDMEEVVAGLKKARRKIEKTVE